jgi:hypothetical protein
VRGKVPRACCEGSDHVMHGIAKPKGSTKILVSAHHPYTLSPDGNGEGQDSC